MNDSFDSRIDDVNDELRGIFQASLLQVTIHLKATDYATSDVVIIFT